MLHARVDPAPDKFYKRSQVEDALWRSLYTASGKPPAIPKVFVTRVRRLLDADRKPLDGAPSRAFGDDDPGGQGHERAYVVFDVFCLGVALELMKRGFKCLEVVFLFRYIRETLQAEFKKLTVDLPAINDGSLVRGQASLREHPTWPADIGYPQVADFKVFLEIRTVEFDEVSPNLRPPRADDPIFEVPRVFYGTRALAEGIDRLNFNFRSAMYVEIRGLAALISWWLPRIRPISRGPRTSRKRNPAQRGV